jgi:hypothetical protein
MADIICDFCSSKPVVARYHAADFEATPFSAGAVSFHQMSVGDWAACRECERLIDSSQWDQLVERAVFYFFVNNPELFGVLSPLTLRDQLMDMYGILKVKDFRKVRFQ